MSQIASCVNLGLNAIKALSDVLGEGLGGAHKEALHLSFLPNCVENCQALITY